MALPVCPSPPCFSFTPDTPCTTTTTGATDPEEEGILGGAPGELAHGGAVPRTYSPLASSSQISKKTIRSYLHWQGPALGRVMVLSLVAGTAAGGKEDLKLRQVAAPGVWSPTHSSKQGKAEQALGRSWGQTGRATKQGSSKAGDSAGGDTHQSRGTQPHPGDLAGRRVLPPTPKAEQREFRMGLPPETPSPALQPQEVQGQDPNHTAPLQHQGSSLWTAREGRLAHIPWCWSRMRAGITANHRTQPNQSDSGLSSQRQGRLAQPLQGRLRELQALSAPGDGCSRRPEEPLALPQPRAGTNPASVPSQLHGPWRAGAAGRRAPPRRAAGGRWRRWRLPARARRACPGASPPEQLAPSSR